MFSRPRRFIPVASSRQTEICTYILHTHTDHARSSCNSSPFGYQRRYDQPDRPTDQPTVAEQDLLLCGYVGIRTYSPGWDGHPIKLPPTSLRTRGLTHCNVRSAPPKGYEKFKIHFNKFHSLWSFCCRSVGY